MDVCRLGISFYCPLLSILLSYVLVSFFYINFYWSIVALCGLPRWLRAKESTCQCRRHGFSPRVWETPWRRKWHPTPVFLPGKAHGQRSGGLQSVGLQRVSYDLVTKQQQIAVLQCYVSFCCTAKSISPSLYTYMRPFGLPSCSGHHSALSRVLCAVQ